jgi:ABC-2 type transport system ATP-binding protein
MVKEMILDLKKQGKAIMLSTHRMNEVEELCDRVFMINKGKNVLYGRLAEIKAKYRNNSVILEYEGDIGGLRGLRTAKINGHSAELFLDGGMTPQGVLEQLVSNKVNINRFESPRHH